MYFPTRSFASIPLPPSILATPKQIPRKTPTIHYPRKQTPQTTTHITYLHFPSTPSISPPTLLLPTPLPTPPPLNNPSYPVNLCLTCAPTADLTLSSSPKPPNLPTRPDSFLNPCRNTCSFFPSGILANSLVRQARALDRAAASRCVVARRRDVSVALARMWTFLMMCVGARRPRVVLFLEATM